MKNKHLIPVAALMMTVLSTTSQAVHISPRGVGQVLIFPYYTARNYDTETHASLYTTYSIVNTTNQAKAIKVRFMEGDNATEVLDFNIYMSAYDVWTGVVGATDNAFRPGIIGGAHGTSETTCAPFLESITYFNPMLIEALDGVDADVALDRSLDGHFVVMEMGTLNAADTALVDHGASGIPSGCDEIESRWREPDGVWLTAGPTLGPVSGGLYGGASLLDVTEGYAVSYDAIALEDFWGASLQGQHTVPGGLTPNLTDAAPVSRVFKDQAFNSPDDYDGGGYVLETSWPSGRGIDAVSALFMTPTLMNEYVYDAARDAKTEWVITFPTKHHHVATEPTAPFSSLWDGSMACDEYHYIIWDREELEMNSSECLHGDPAPPGSVCRQIVCHSANVAEFLRPEDTANATSQILGADNLTVVIGSTHPSATLSGWARIRFEEPTMVLTGGEGASYRGLPAVGFMLQRYTNAAAQPGLLAQYATAFNHVTEVASF